VKRFGWILLLLMAAPHAWAANKKITVQELNVLLASMQQNKKTDPEVAEKLTQIDLTEELTHDTMSKMSGLVPGSLTGAELELLEGKTSFLAPPPADLPSAPAPDAAAQKAILAKAMDYATKTYMQNPHLSVFKSTVRYQDDARRTGVSEAPTAILLNGPMQLFDRHIEPVEMDKGIEKAAVSRAKTKWGENGRISEGEPGFNLGAVVGEASAMGKFDWLRWQTIDGKPVAVFSFAVDKKKSHFDVSYCCFPDASVGGSTAVGGHTVLNTNWVPFKKVVGYHGEIFVSPDSGAIVRIITNAELNPTSLVTKEGRRIDYARVVVEGKEYLLPRVAITLVEAVPNGDRENAVYRVRHTLLNAVYQNYKMADAH